MLRRILSFVLISSLLFGAASAYAAPVQFVGAETGVCDDEAYLCAGSISVATTPVNTGTYSYDMPATTGNAAGLRIHCYSGNGNIGNSGCSVADTYFQMYARFTTLPNVTQGSVQLVNFQNTGFSQKAQLLINSSGNLILKNQAGTTLATGATVLTTGTWYRIEAHIPTGTTASYEVKINGTSEISGTGDFTVGNGGEVTVGPATATTNGSFEMFVDDVAIDNAAYPGGVFVKIMVPAADGTTHQWTSGTNTSDYTQVNDKPKNTATYEQSNGTANQTALVSLVSSSTAGIQGSIKATKTLVQLSTPTGTSSSKVDTCYPNGGTCTQTTAHVLTSTLTFEGKIMTTAGDGTTALSTTVLDSTQIGAVEVNAVADRMSEAWLMVLSDQAAPTATPTATATSTATATATSTPTATATSSLPILPGLTGFGSHNVGGSGRHLTTPAGTIYHVSNCADSGAGSLRACAIASGPRICVFDVSCEIKTATNIQITNPYITIAGATAPWPGIEIRGGQLQPASHNQTIENIHSRAGDDLWAPSPTSRSCMTIVDDLTGTANNIVVDHCSLGWSLNTCMNTYSNDTTGLHDITWSNNLVEEPLYNSFRGGGPQSTGALVDRFATNMTYKNNLFVHAFSRLPLSKAGTQVEWINNLVYGWGFGQNGHPDGGFYEGDVSDYDETGDVSKWIVQGNTYVPDLCSNLYESFYSSAAADNFPTGSKIYAYDNIDPIRTNSGQAQNLILGNVLPTYYATAAPFTGAATPVPQTTAKAYALQSAGAYAAHRDNVDQRNVDDVNNRTGTYRNCVADDGSARCASPHNAGGWPSYPPLYRPFVEPTNPYGVDAGTGYTNIEVVLHQYSDQANGVVATWTPTPTPTGPTSTPTSTWTPLATWTSSPTPVSTNTPIPTITGGYGCFSLNPTWSPTPTNTPTVTATSTPTPTPTATPTVTPTPTPTVTPTATNTPAVTSTPKHHSRMTLGVGQ